MGDAQYKKEANIVVRLLKFKPGSVQAASDKA